MATSGTISTTTFDTTRVIETAFRRCKVVPEQISAEMADTARDALYVLLSELPAYGLQLWAIDKQILPAIERKAAVPLPVGTVDVTREALFRTTQEVAATGSAPNAYTYRLTATTATEAVVMGVKFGTGGTFAFTLQWWDGASWVTQQTLASAAYTAGIWYWFDLDPALDVDQIQLVESSSAAIDIDEGYLGNMPQEIPLARISQDDYTALPNKAFAGRPVQFWLDRQAAQPIMRVWPTPSADYEKAQFVIWRQRHVMDVGTLQQSLEIPQRWLNAIIARLALRLFDEVPGIDASLGGRLAAADADAMRIIQNDERDASPMTMAPNISYYTA